MLDKAKLQNLAYIKQSSLNASTDTQKEKIYRHICTKIQRYVGMYIEGQQKLFTEDVISSTPQHLYEMDLWHNSNPKN